MSVALAERGHTFTAFYAEDGALRDQYEAQPGITLQRIPGFDLTPANPLRAARVIASSVQALSRNRPDVVWLSRYEHIAWAQLIARTARAPLVCHLHHGLNHRLIKPLSKRVDVFIAVSDYMRDYWVRRGIDPARTFVVHNAIPLSRYRMGGLAERSAARVTLGIPEDAFVAVYAGRMIREKGVDVLTRAWGMLGLDSAKGRLVLVGLQDDDDPAYLAETRDQAPLDTVDWLPMRADVLPLLHAADVIVVPSRYDEPFGRVVIEGMATGRPVLASRSGAIPEILHGPMDRFLFARESADELAVKLRELVDWRTNEPELETQCRQWVAKEFPFERMIDHLEGIFRSTKRDTAAHA
jgi:glycosyltransferase involved in cell wall biosynthesis